MVYALKDKKYFQFRCVSKTKEEFEEKIEASYWNWRGMRPRSESLKESQRDYYMSQYIKVEITINQI